MKRKLIIGLLIFLGIVAICISLLLIISLKSYKALDEANKYLETIESVSVVEYKDYYIFEGNDAKKGIIFYPGGLVNPEAYAPLMHELAELGYCCVLLDVAFNLAVLDINRADGIIEEHEHIEKWYLAGHSLGGTIAGIYLDKNEEMYEGLILLGSYITNDFSNTNIKVLSIYGENDKVLNMKNYQQNLSNLPKDYVEVVIDGGCHSYFGMYGLQKGDGNPSITNDLQIKITVENISLFLETEWFVWNVN